ncbi:MAG: hypothetical protein KAJ07_01350 [Planctomycetes bacterium]|nr:hypothetical protein [Planctomycetota bacterium]
MKRSKFNETKMLAILKEAEAGMTVSEIRRMRNLEEENKKLKQMYADLSLENNVLKELIEKNF